MTFYKWLSTQTHRDDEIGDIAIDIGHDSKINNKTGIRKLRKYIQYLSHNNENVMKALENAYFEYKS